MKKSTTISFDLKFIFPLLLLVGISTMSQAQLILPESKKEPATLLQLNKKARFLKSAYPDSAILITDQILAKADPNTMPATIGSASLTGGMARMSKGKLIEAEKMYQLAIVQFRRLGDSLALADVFDMLGYALNAQGYIAKHLELQLKALDYRQRFDAPLNLIARSYGSVGNVYFELNQMELALENYQKSLSIRQAIKDKRVPPQSFGFSMFNIGKVLFRQKKFAEAERYYQQSIDSFKVARSNQFILQVTQALGKLYTEQGDLAKANLYLNEALDFSNKIEATTIRGKVFVDLAALYEAQGEPRKAIEALETAVETFKKTSSRKNLKIAYQTLAELHEIEGNNETAVRYFKAFDAIKDSLLTDESVQKLAELQVKYDLEQKEQKIELLEERQQQEKNLRLLLVFGILLTLGAAFSIFIANEKRKKAYLELVTEKEKTDRLYKDLQFAQSQLVQSEKMASLGQLTAGIAHEINNPVNYITSSVEAMKLDFEDLKKLLDLLFELEQKKGDDPLPELFALARSIDAKYVTEEMTNLIESIERGALRTKDIVKNLRTFSRGTNESTLEADLHEGLNSTIAILTHKMKDRIQLHRDYADLPPVRCHISRLNQVFLNMLDNAIQAINGNGDIYVKTYQEDGFVKISIKDTGTGIDKATQQKLFEPFFTTKEIGKGTGLGLSISYGIIEQHGGKITVQSSPGNGAEFIVSLPVH
ncbi:MAG: tetratricopeptide repeat protein [Bacteroidota bacterium]